MKTEMKTVLASVVIVAMALTAISGITYSWFSDTETAKIDVSTGYVDIKTAPTEMKLSSTYDTANTNDVSWSNSSMSAVFPYGGSDLHKATVTDKKSYYAVDIVGIVTGDMVQISFAVTNNSSLPAYITCVSNHDKDLLDVSVSVLKNESLLDVPVNGERVLNVTIKLKDDAKVDSKQQTSFDITFTGYQGNYASTINQDGTAIITGNKIVTGDVEGTGSAKDVEMKVDFSKVTTVNDFEILGNSLTVESKLSGIDNEFGTISLTLSKDGTAITSPVFNDAVTVTAVFQDVDSDPEEVIIKCGDETVKQISAQYDSNARTFTVVFSTNHFSDFTIAHIVAKIGETGYTSLKAAFDAVKDNDSIQMVNDSTEKESIASTKTDVSLDIGDYNITFENDGIRVNSGSLTITGEKGSITGGSDATPNKEYLPAYVMGGTLTIEGGKFISTSCAECVYAFKDTQLIITGGVFESNVPEKKGNGWLVNVKDTGSINCVKISGGSFKGYNPMDGDNTLGGSFLADGYTFEYENGYYNVIEGDAPKATVSSVEEMKIFMTSFASGKGNSTVTIGEDITLEANDSWTSIFVDGNHGAGVITIDGNGKTISKLDAPLFAGGFAGNSGIIIKNLTISDSIINSNIANGSGYGAFIANVDAMPTITLDNCHLKNCTVGYDDSNLRTGGLIGWTSGYYDPPKDRVDTTVTIKNCSVNDCIIISNKSVGAIIGHAGANPATYHYIQNCEISNNKLTSSKDKFTGIVVGTSNVGMTTITDMRGENNKCNDIDASFDNLTDYYGRLALGETGKLSINGNYIVDSKNAFNSVINQNISQINIQLTEDISVDYDGYETFFGGIDTEKITIEGNQHCLTFNSLNTNLSVIQMTHNDDNKDDKNLNLKNLTLKKTGVEKGTTWDAHDIVFDTPVTLTNVTSMNAIALCKNSSLDKVTITDSLNTVYLLWITSDGQTVNLNECKILKSDNSNDTRGIAIKDQYRESNQKKVTLNISNSEFSTDTKAAILVTTDVGAEINLNAINIEKVNSDSTNAVWCDNEKSINLIEVTGGTIIIEP